MSKPSLTKGTPKYRLEQAARKKERFLLLGQITHDWNFLEHQIAQLTSHYTLDPDATYSIAARLRNAEATDALIHLVREREHRKRMIAAYEFAVKAFHRLRENRNMLVHSHGVIEITQRAVLWSRKSKSNPSNTVMVYGGIQDLKRIAADITRLRNYLHGLLDIAYYEWLMSEPPPNTIREAAYPRGRPALPKRFPLPRKLEENPPGPLRAPRPPRS